MRNRTSNVTGSSWLEKAMANRLIGIIIPIGSKLSLLRLTNTMPSASSVAAAITPRPTHSRLFSEALGRRIPA